MYSILCFGNYLNVLNKLLSSAEKLSNCNKKRDKEEKNKNKNRVSRAIVSQGLVKVIWSILFQVLTAKTLVKINKVIHSWPDLTKSHTVHLITIFKAPSTSK